MARYSDELGGAEPDEGGSGVFGGPEPDEQATDVLGEEPE